MPAEFRFDGEIVYVRRDDVTGDVMLSSRPRSTWREFMMLREHVGPLDADLLADRTNGSDDAEFGAVASLQTPGAQT